jgi:hypothetical protein
MPLTYERNDPRRRIILTAVGAVSLEESMATLERKAADGAWDYATVYDGRGRDGLLETTEIVHLVSRTVVLSKRYGPAGPLAIVRIDPAGLDGGRMFEIFSSESGRLVGVFRTLPDAERWLDGLADVTAETTGTN